MFDLAVAYRIYPGVSKSPAFFSTDKFELSRLCLRSFKQSLGDLRVKVWALLDGCPPEYEALFREFFPENLEIVSLEKVGNLATFSLQVDILTRQTDAPYVYFAEDDFFYLPDALAKLFRFMQSRDDVDFATAYDHPDSYDTSSRFERHLVSPFEGRYWRTASSTVLTFMTRRTTLVETASIFRSYSRGNHDCSLWLALTQKWALLNPRIQWADFPRFVIWAKMLIWGTGRVLFKPSRKLWVPLPALATHMESTRLAPLVDWQYEFTRATAPLDIA